MKRIRHIWVILFIVNLHSYALAQQGVPLQQLEQITHNGEPSYLGGVPVDTAFATTDVNGKWNAVTRDSFKLIIESLGITGGGGADDQNLENASIDGSHVLSVGIEDGTGVTVDLSQLKDTPSDLVYSPSWNGNTDAATKNVIYDKLETISGGASSIYTSGNALIKASAAGVTYSVGGSIGTLTIPTGVRLEYVRINHQSADIGSAVDFTLRIDDENGDVNQGMTTYMPPMVQFVKRDNGGADPPTSGNPFVYTQDSPPTSQVQIVEYGSDVIDIRFKNVDNYSKWTVLASF